MDHFVGPVKIQMGLDLSTTSYWLSKLGGLGINYLKAVMKCAFLMACRAFLVVVVEMTRVEADDLQDCAAFGHVGWEWFLLPNTV